MRGIDLLYSVLELNVLLVWNLNWLLTIDWLLTVDRLLTVGWLLTVDWLLLTELWLTHGLHLRLSHTWVVSHWLLDTLCSESSVNWHGLLGNDNLRMILLVMMFVKIFVALAFAAEDDAVRLSNRDPECPC